MDDTNKACSTAVTALSKLSTTQRAVSPGVPPARLTPITSGERLAQAAAEEATDEAPDHPASNTVLYLAYGSNLCAETFLHVRGIRPLSQVNVSVPALRLTFDLPGSPYTEPCFANVAWRKIPKNPKLPPVPKLPPTPPIEPPKPTPVDPNPPHVKSQWGGELIGVVYEVTREDYSHIIETEGGGSSYKEIVVPCIPIPPPIAVPEKPPIPELPRPFLARTLFAPYVPDSELPDDPRKEKWWYKYIIPPHRPSPDYAQASARYLKLIRDGAREHELPEEYQEYLDALEPYTITSWRQELGRLLFAAILRPLILLIFMRGKWFADKDGKLPPWLMIMMAVIFNVTWRLYDAVAHPLLGDGERTEEKKGREEAARRWRTLGPACDEEKASLLNDEQEM